MINRMVVRASCCLLSGCMACGCFDTASAQLDTAAWRIVDVSSENVLTGEPARFAIDGNGETQWHTRWHDARESAPAQPPHVITIDFGKVEAVDTLRYRARPHGVGGLPKKYLLELSTDSNTWNQAAKGEFKFRSSMSPHASIVLEHPIPTRFLRLTIQSLYENRDAKEPGLVVSELDIATPEVPLQPTTLIPIPQSREWNIGGYLWRNRHRDLLAYAARESAQLIFLGDSITHRWGAPPHDDTPRTGEAVWNKYYGHRNTLCLGYGWDRIENMLWRLRHGELEHTNPRLVIVMAGTNNLEVNTPLEIAAGVAGLCDEIHRQKPRTQVLLLAIFPRGNNRRNPPLEETNGYLSELDQRPYITFRDIGSVFLNTRGQLTREIMPDLLHPGPDGYRRWAQAIEGDVSAILGDTPVTN